ncbi:TraA family conjugative transfer protein [Thiomicrorhabdus aquaedulcis]|uniref:TraA family conjugative transfer protein n=1 Tax=Thiomicrorhabdus aquaedulcis TaxID=2211106 RepID=UPI000FD9E76B|nr:TraA family conjugative transfer protein [Thiomicrorhabdus aquaedulcis]
MKHKMILKTVFGAGLLIASGAVLASTTGSEFQTVYDKFEGWVQGYGGMAIAIGAIGLGGLASLAKQTPFPILTGIGSAILLQYSPDIVSSIMTATI